MNSKKQRQMAYTRREYIAGTPSLKVSRFTLGKSLESFTNIYLLEVTEDGLLGQGSLEAARIAANKVLQDALGENNYVLRIIPFPHLVIRQHRFLAQAGADRLSQGMKRSFGKPTDLAAKVRIGDPIIEIRVGDVDPKIAREAFRLASSKMALRCRMREVEKYDRVEKT
jgi:large subunit ribosomal protein L10e